MNGAATRRGEGFGPARRAPGPGTAPGPGLGPGAIGPNGRAMVEGYRKDILNGFEKDKPRYNPVRAPRHKYPRRRWKVANL